MSWQLCAEALQPRSPPSRQSLPAARVVSGVGPSWGQGARAQGGSPEVGGRPAGVAEHLRAGPCRRLRQPRVVGREPAQLRAEAEARQGARRRRSEGGSDDRRGRRGAAGDGGAQQEQQGPEGGAPRHRLGRQQRCQRAAGHARTLKRQQRTLAGKRMHATLSPPWGACGRPQF